MSRFHGRGAKADGETLDGQTLFALLVHFHVEGNSNSLGWGLPSAINKKEGDMWKEEGKAEHTSDLQSSQYTFCPKAVRVYFS